MDQNEIENGAILTRKYKENPGSHFTCRSQTAEVKLSNRHGNSIFDSVGEGEEVSKVSTEDKEKEAAEGTKNNNKLHNECREADETQLDCSSNLSEGLLETKQ